MKFIFSTRFTTLPGNSSGSILQAGEPKSKTICSKHSGPSAVICIVFRTISGSTFIRHVVEKTDFRHLMMMSIMRRRTISPKCFPRWSPTDGSFKRKYAAIRGIARSYRTKRRKSGRKSYLHLKNQAFYKSIWRNKIMPDTMKTFGNFNVRILRQHDQIGRAHV